MPKNPVTITFSGDQQVIKNILKKKKLLAKNDSKHREIRTVLLLPGGGQEGIIESGAGVALEELELVDTFDYVVGVSTGAPVGYYLLGKQMAIGTTVYFQDNVKNHFVNLLRLWRVMDIDTLENVFKKEKPIDIEVLLKGRSKFLVGIANKDTGEASFADVKKAVDPLSCIIAAICVPVLDGGKTVLLNGKLFVDGGMANPLPITYCIEKLKATDILVVLPDPLIPKYSPLFRMWGIFSLAFPRWISPKVRSQITTVLERYNSEQAYLRGEREIPRGVHIGAIHPKNKLLNEITMNKMLLQEAALSAMTFTQNLFSQRPA